MGVIILAAYTNATMTYVYAKVFFKRSFLVEKSSNKLLASLGCSSLGALLSAVVGSILTVLLSLLLFAPGAYDWYNHNAALNNGEWAMVAAIVAIGFMLVVIVIAGLVGAIVSGLFVVLVLFLISVFRRDQAV